MMGESEPPEPPRNTTMNPLQIEPTAEERGDPVSPMDEQSWKARNALPDGARLFVIFGCMGAETGSPGHRHPVRPAVATAVLTPSQRLTLHACGLSPGERSSLLPGHHSPLRSPRSVHPLSHLSHSHTHGTLPALAPCPLSLSLSLSLSLQDFSEEDDLARRAMEGE